MIEGSTEILERIATARDYRNKAELVFGEFAQKSINPQLNAETRENYKKEARKTWLYMNYYDRTISALHSDLITALSREAMPRDRLCKTHGHLMLKGEARCFRCGKPLEGTV